MHYLSSIYLVNQPLHVSGIFVAHHQEVYCIYTNLVGVVLFSWLSFGWWIEVLSGHSWFSVLRPNRNDDLDNQDCISQKILIIF